MTSTLKRLLALLAVFSLVIAACGSDSGDDSADGESTEDNTADDSDSSGADDSDTVELTQGGTLDEVLARGKVNCGVSGQAVAFSQTQADGSITGLDADFCRAVAAAVFGDAEAVELKPLSATDRFTAVQTGEVDVLMRNTTWTQSRDTEVGMDFGPTTYYDGQQMMARESDGFSADSGFADLEGSIVCTNAGTTTEKNISEGAAAAGVEITLNTSDDWDAVVQTFIDGACDVLTTDGSGLVGRKATQQPDGENWVIFPAQPISKEPLGPTYGQNDSQWADIINWTVYATIIADEKGVTSANVDDMLANGDDEVKRLLGGADDELQSGMGLSGDAFYQVIKQMGNYDEIFARHLNEVGIKREGSANARWNEGGLIYAPPAR